MHLLQLKAHSYSVTLCFTKRLPQFNYVISAPTVMLFPFNTLPQLSAVSILCSNIVLNDFQYSIESFSITESVKWLLCLFSLGQCKVWSLVSRSSSNSIIVGIFHWAQKVPALHWSITPQNHGSQWCLDSMDDSTDIGINFSQLL